MSKTLPSKFVPDATVEQKGAAFQVRLAQDGDHDAIYTLLRGDTSDIPKNDPRHPLQERDKILRASRDPDSKTRCWLAVWDGKPVGIITTRDLSGGVFIDEQHRGKRIADALVNTRDVFLAGIGETISAAHIRVDNEASIKLHKRCGYDFDEKSKRMLKEAPSGNTVIVMTKSLAGLASEVRQQSPAQKPTSPRLG